jgi:hypothetical protein
MPYEKQAAEQYRLAQANRMRACFQQFQGRPAKTTDELNNWYVEHQDEVPRDDRGKVVPLYDD